MDSSSVDPIKPFPCELCDKTFVAQVHADRHMWAVNHYRNSCDECQQQFPSEGALLSHRMTHTHCIYIIHCPFCGARFDEASTMMAHLEEGKCKRAPGLEHHSILWLVRNCDPAGVMVDTQFRWLMSKWIPTPPRGTAKVHMCFTCHRIFPTKEELKVHLKNPMADPPKHRPRFYRCPDQAGRCRKKYFPSLTALFKHLETGSCGTMTYHDVQQMHGQLANMFWGFGIGQPKKRGVVFPPNASIMHP